LENKSELLDSTEPGAFKDEIAIRIFDLENSIADREEKKTQDRLAFEFREAGARVKRLRSSLEQGPELDSEEEEILIISLYGRP